MAFQPVLIGSRALNFWYPELCKVKESTDWDIICSPESTFGFDNYEVHSVDFLNNADMLDYTSGSSIDLPDGTKVRVMSVLGLAIIKRSHLWRDLGFSKHITMYHKTGLASELQRKLVVGVGIKYDLENRTKLTKEAYPQGHPNLMQLKDDFFDDAVSKKYQHDDLHQMFAFYEEPIYTRLLKYEGMAYCCKDKWDNLSHLDKILAVVEEAAVISAERFLIPKGWDTNLDFKEYPVKLAYIKAVNKICTTLCSGYFRDFAINSYPEVLEMFDNVQYSKVQSTLFNNSKGEAND